MSAVQKSACIIGQMNLMSLSRLHNIFGKKHVTCMAYTSSFPVNILCAADTYSAAPKMISAPSGTFTASMGASSSLFTYVPLVLLRSVTLSSSPAATLRDLAPAGETSCSVLQCFGEVVLTHVEERMPGGDCRDRHDNVGRWLAAELLDAIRQLDGAWHRDSLVQVV